MLMRQLTLPMTVLIGCLFAASFLVAEDVGNRLSRAGQTASVPASAATSQASQPTTASQAATGGVTGKVVAKDGTLVAGATVNLFDPQGHALVTTQSDAEGVFMLKDAPTGKGYFVQASVPPHPAMGRKMNVSVQTGQVTDIGTIVIPPPEIIAN
jgi:hypothetical protein